jgi:hypothetical protein
MGAAMIGTGATRAEAARAEATGVGAMGAGAMGAGAMGTGAVVTGEEAVCWGAEALAAAVVWPQGGWVAVATRFARRSRRNLSHTRTHQSSSQTPHRRTPPPADRP